MGVWPIHYLPPTDTQNTQTHTHTQHRITHAAIPAGEASDCAMSAAMAVFEFSLLPNMCDGARLKTDPESPLTYGQIEKKTEKCMYTKLRLTEHYK